MDTKTCKKCGAEKSVDDFYRDGRMDPNGKTRGRMGQCKLCSDSRKKKWENENRERYQQRNRNYYQANKKAHQFYKLNRSYGVTEEWYVQTLASQGGVCAICKTADPGSGDGRRSMFSVDHDHKTGKVRGLLCISCNMILGGVDDNVTLLRSAISYVEEHHENS